MIPTWLTSALGIFGNPIQVLTGGIAKEIGEGGPQPLEVRQCLPDRRLLNTLLADTTIQCKPAAVHCQPRLFHLGNAALSVQK